MVTLHLIRFLIGVYAIVLVGRSQGGWASWFYGYSEYWRSSSYYSSSRVRGCNMSEASDSPARKYLSLTEEEKRAYLGLLRNDLRSHIRAKPMSPGQKIVITRMLRDREIPAEFVAAITDELPTLSLERAGRVIDILGAFPRKRHGR